MAISLNDESIEFSFPEVDEAARMRVTLHRTARVPDDGREYGLLAGFGSLPMRRVVDLPMVPGDWERAGGVVLPMWQSEVCRLSYDVADDYPFLVIVGCGGVNAVTGGTWSAAPDFEGEDYVEVSPSSRGSTGSAWQAAWCASSSPCRWTRATRSRSNSPVAPPLAVTRSPSCR